MTDNTPKINGEHADKGAIGGFETVTATPFYDCNSKGVYYHTFDTDRQGNVSEKPPQRLSDPVYIIGYGIDGAGKHYRVIQWTDKLQHERKTTALPMSDIGVNWGVLQGMGIAIAANRRKRELLADYLMTEGAKTRYIITNQAGWVANYSAYALPNGKIITADGKAAPRIIYNGDTSQAQYYDTRGTLTDWQQQIARYAAGNSRLCLVLGAAFAAPLMRLLDIEGGGFHLFGDSSDGKTTVAKVALSVWGKADDLKLSWEGTGHGFSNIANAKNDNLMVLDEIGQAAPRVVAHTAYSVINGTGKVQGAKEGGNRHINRWRVLVLSTGEKTLEGFLKAGKGEWHAGQANRLPSIPANAGKDFGVFDTLHDMPTGAALSEHLSHVSNEFYGVAGIAFVKALLADLDGAKRQIHDIIHAFLDSLPPLTGQSRRVAYRFALVAAALELAGRYGISGIAPTVASLEIKQCFDAWLMREGMGKYEDRRILEQVFSFFEQYGDTERFAYWNDIFVPRDHAGYKEMHTNDFDNITHVDYWTISPVFQSEICGSFDVAKVRDVLTKNNILQRGKKKAMQQRKVNKIGKWFYVLRIQSADSDEALCTRQI